MIIQRRPAADARRAGGRLLLPHADERELPAPGDARGRRGGDPARHVPAARGARARRAGAAARARARSCARSLAGGRAARATTSASSADVWSVTSFTELRRDGMEAERWNRLHPGEEPRAPVRRRSCSTTATARWSPRPTTCARSPTRSARTCPGRYTRARHRRLRPQRLPRARCGAFFEVDRHHVAVAALSALADAGEVDERRSAEAIEQLRDRRRRRRRRGGR